MKKIIILSLLCFNCLWCNPFTIKINMEEHQRIHSEQLKVEKYNTLNTKSLEQLKEFEGLRLTRYIDCGGFSIGYGHHLKEGETYRTISERQADSLIVVDFEQSISDVEKLTGFKRTEYPEKVLALAHFTFNFGTGAFANSTLLKYIKCNKRIDSEIIKWVKAKSGDEVIILHHLQLRRSYELNLYYGIS